MVNKQEWGVPTQVPSPNQAPSNGLFEAAFAFAAIFLFGYCICMWYYGSKSLDWTSTQGQIISSQKVMKEDTSGDIGSRRTEYVPEVQYSYSVGQQKLSSKDIHPPLNDSGTWFNGEAQTELTLLKYPQNSTVTVFFNPQDPGQACLEPGTNYQTFAMVFLFVVMFSIVPLWRPALRLKEIIAPTKPVLITKTIDGKRVMLSSFREKEDEI